MEGPSGGVFVPLLIAQLLLLVTFAIILLGLFYYCCSIAAPVSRNYRTVQYPVLFSITVSYGLLHVFGELILYVAASLQYSGDRIPQWVAVGAISGSLVIEPIVFVKVRSASSSHIWNAIATAYFSGIMGLSIAIHHAMAWPRSFLLSIYSGTLCMAIIASAVIHTISTHIIPNTEQTRLPVVARSEKHEPPSQKSFTWFAFAAFVLLWGVQSMPQFIKIDTVLEQAIDLYLMLLVIIAAIVLQMAEVTLLGWRIHPVFLTAVNGLAHESFLCDKNNVQLAHAALRIVKTSCLSGALGFIGSGMIIYYGKRNILPNYIEPYNG